MVQGMQIDDSQLQSVAATGDNDSTASSAPDAESAVRLVSSRQLVQMARGFSCSFWGIPISLLLFFGAVDVDVMEKVRLPAYILGVLLVYVGFILLHRSRPVSSRWKSWARQGLLLSFVLVYFSPFVYWWERLPFAPFYIANMLVLVICATWLLLSVNRLASEIGRALGDRTFALEADLCGWCTVCLLGLPILLSLGFTIHSTGLAELDWLTQWVTLNATLSRWVYIFILIPITLTMTSAWKAKESCMQAALTHQAGTDGGPA